MEINCYNNDGGVECKSCGGKIYCNGDKATCTDKAECEGCGEPYGEEPNGHTPEADDGNCTTEVVCSVCGETKTEAIEKIDHVHNYEAVVTAPTCTAPGYTAYTCACGESYTVDEVAALGHIYTYTIVNGKPVKSCTRCKNAA
ncbi:MAG: hypothetical protein J6I45_05755 [Clostridia bacterium]|nr:hypothetical protein [Clostridia bacterium]